MEEWHPLRLLERRLMDDIRIDPRFAEQTQTELGVPHFIPEVVAHIEEYAHGTLAVLASWIIVARRAA